MKDRYLAYLKGAGFHEVKLAGEDIYPVRLTVKDSLVRMVYPDAGRSDHRGSGSVAGIKVSATKPEQSAVR